MNKCAIIFRDAPNDRYSFVCYHCCETFFCAIRILAHLDEIHYTESTADGQRSEIKVKPADDGLTTIRLETQILDSCHQQDESVDQQLSYNGDNIKLEFPQPYENQLIVTEINDDQQYTYKETNEEKQIVAEINDDPPIEQATDDQFQWCNDDFDSVSSASDSDDMSTMKNDNRRRRQPPAKARPKKVTLKPKNAKPKPTKIKPTFECDYCGKIIKEKHKLIEHMENIHIHSDEKPAKYQCDLCPKKYFYRQSFVYHQRCHSGEKPYQCSTCGVRYLMACALSRHEQLRHLNVRFQCTKCGKKLNTPYSLQQHQRTHSDERLYGCTVCEKRFKIRCTLVEHMKTHDPVKRYQCTLCPMAFATFSARRGHERTKHALVFS